MARLFFALWPDPATRAALSAAAAQLELTDGRRVPPERLHLTLHFLGEVDALVTAALHVAGAGVQASAFELEIARAGWWRHSAVAWLQPLNIPDALVELIAEVRQAVRASGLGLAATNYEPHVTVARKVSQPPRLTASVSVAWKVREFALVASRSEPAGAHYEVLKTWPLAPAPDD